MAPKKESLKRNSLPKGGENVAGPHEAPEDPAEDTSQGKGKFYYPTGATYGEWKLATEQAPGAPITIAPLVKPPANAKPPPEGMALPPPPPPEERPRPNRRRHGKGLYIDGSYEYNGEWQNDKMHGKGCFKYASGASYDGQWEENIYMGDGTYKWPNGATYTGQWRDNKMHGDGTYIDKDGNTWTGQFFNGTGPARGRKGRGRGDYNDDECNTGSDSDGAPSGGAGGPSEYTKKVAMFCFCVAAIYAAYISQGVLQENISTKAYGSDGQRFDHLTFLNLTQCLMCFLWSFLMLRIWPGEPGTEAPILAYWGCSVSNTIGPACGILALKYISYPAQVLAKSSKMIPVMLLGALIYGVKYSLEEYLCTFLVAGGVSVFALFKSNNKTTKVAAPNALVGYTLCFLNLALDGFTNATQDALTARYPKVNAWHLMMGMNLWGTLYMTAFMFLVPGGGGYAAVQFCLTHPDATWDIFLFCFCGAIGQNFIFTTISQFGALTNTTITTTRKFVSILVSSLWNGNPLSPQQWTGVFMVFVGLSYQIWCKYQKKNKAPESGSYSRSRRNSRPR